MSSHPEKDHLDQLMEQFRHLKTKDKKHLVKLELARTKDTEVKKVLKEILKDIDKKQRRNKFIGLFLAIMVAIVGCVFIYQSIEGKKVPTEKKEKIVKTETKTTEKKPLTKEQGEEWVEAVLAKRYEPEVPSHLLKSEVDAKDQLIYIQVMPPEGTRGDTMGSFRINQQNELEELGYFVQDAADDEWVVISKKWLDVSKIKKQEVEELADKQEVKEEVKEAPVQETPVQEEPVVNDLTPREFAQLYADFVGNSHPVMHIKEYGVTYGHIEEYDDSLQVVIYNDYSPQEGDVLCNEITPMRMPNFFFTYNNLDQQVYINENNASRGREVYPELTEYVRTHR